LARVTADRLPSPSSSADEDRAEPWLDSFHRGERECLETCYREHFDVVDQIVGRFLERSDRETVVHEIFYRLLADEHLRRAFQGGSFAAWLRTVSRNQAIDYARRRGLEIPAGDDLPYLGAGNTPPAHLAHQVEARLVLQTFRNEVLPLKWRRVFDARFLEQRDQPDAARSLGMSRTTLAYQEYRIRKLIRRFVLRGDVL
jgi:RNA polymerase sigma-70 factor (ECF subfamily)